MSVIVTAEVGINHNGDIEVAKQLATAAKQAGADYVKFQKRDPDMRCEAHRDFKRLRETPWGTLTHLEYRQRLEFGQREFDAIDQHCRKIGIGWFMSVWDEPSLEFALRYDPPFIKLPSALLTDWELIKQVIRTGRNFVLSTGMSDWVDISEAAQIARDNARLGQEKYLLHCHAAYPAPTEELSLRLIPILTKTFSTWHIGYSGHEQQLEPSVVAAALGAKMIERHLTLDHNAWGSDHKASIEPDGFGQLVRRIHSVEEMLGTPCKQIWPSERDALEKLRPPEIRRR